VSNTKAIQAIDELTAQAWANNRSEPQKCKEISIKQMEEAEKIDYFIGKINAQAALGASLVWLSNYDEALTNLYQAREDLKKIGNKKKEAEVVYHIFCSFYFLADYDHAIEYANQILELAEENKDDSAKANAYNGIGTIYYTIGENKKAIENLTLGIKIAEKLTDKHLLARLFDGLGTAYFQNGELEKAIIYKDKSSIAARESGIKNVEAYALNGLANIYFELKNYDLAEQLYFQSINLRKEVNFKPGVAESLASLGKLYLTIGKTDEAYSYLQEALQIAEEIDSKEFLYKIYESLSEYYASKNKIEEFKKHYQLYFHNKEKYTNEKHRQTIKSKEMKLRMSQVEKEKEILEKKHEELENYSRDLELLSSIGRKITSLISVEKINKTVHELLQTMMDATGFGIGVIINEGKNLEFPGYIEEGVIYKTSQYDLSDENRMATICFNHSKEILIKDFEIESSLYIKRNTKPVIGKSVQSLIYLPLISEQRKVGVITVQSFEKDAYSEYHLNLLRNLAVYCAIALENASSYEKLEEMVSERTKAVTNSYETTKLLNNLGQELTALNKFEDIFQKLYTSISQLMDAGCFGIRIYIPEKEIIEYRFEMEKGIIDSEVVHVPMSNDNNYSVWCVKNKDSIFINDNILEHKKWVNEIHVVSGDMPHSLLFQPMMLGEKIIGVITVQSFERNAYQPHHLDILKTLANYTAIAFENANSIELLEERVNERTQEISKQKEQLEKTFSNTKRFSEIGKDISAMLSAGEIIAKLYNSVNSLLDATIFGVAVYRPEENDLFFSGAMENSKALPNFSFPLDEDKISTVCFQKQKEIIINDWEKEYRQYISKNYNAKQGEIPESMIYLPLVSKGNIIGVITVQSFSKHAYQDYHVDILRSLSVYVGSAVENANLYKSLEVKVKERTKEIEKAYQDTKLLSQISKDISASLSVETIIEKVYHSVNRLMDATGFGIGIFNPSTQQIKMPGYIEKGEKLEDFYYNIQDDRLATWCFKNKKEIFINDYTVEYKNYIQGIKKPIAGKDSASIIYLPLFLKTEVMGILTIQSFEKNVYTEYHLDILRSLANSIATALDNAQLYENMEEKVKERTFQVVKQKEIIEEKNKHITDSIIYAKRIQQAILPPE
jgi:transcriptional regulator with GAF, ATPase, and Fis domain/lipopolysaccharide biosynthesis regulator YciM